jgi:phosphotriesterase-related protein
MLKELEEGVEDTGVRAGFIKLSAGDDGITAAETKVLRAAARAAAQTGAIIGSHTVRGRVVADQLRIIAEAGGAPDRFIWIHAQNDPDFALNLEMARQGAWIEYDAISRPDRDQFYVERIQGMLAAGFGDKLLLSHDNGWYDPGKPNGGTPRPFTYLSETFLPLLRASGVPADTIRRLTVDNPFRAFAR